MGLKHASGDYVQFIDIDDMLVDEHVISSLVDICQRDGLDCLRFTFKVLNESKHSDVANKFTKYYTMKGDVKSYTDQVMSGTELYFRLKSNGCYHESAAVAMFRMGLLKDNGIQFVENIIHEDVLFTPMVLQKCKRCM